MASLVAEHEITPQQPLVPPADPVTHSNLTIPSPGHDPPPWEHPFHQKFLTLNFAGYLILKDDWLDKVSEFVEGGSVYRAQLLRDTGCQGEDTFRELVDEFESEVLPEKGLIGFTKVLGGELGAGRREFFAKKCEKDILTEIGRYKSIYIPKDTSVTKQETSDKTPEPIPDKFQPILPLVQLETRGDREGYTEALREETERRVELEVARSFRMVFGRRDHHLVASLVSALWSMGSEGDIRMAHIPREQLLSVDMEARPARELTLQLHPNKPVYKRRDRDEVRGWEEIFVDALPWCRVPGGRALSGVIDNQLFERLSERPPVPMWTEDQWEMRERKRRDREERKRDKDTVPLKVTDARVQVNHFLPLLKEITGFKGYIREDRFYEGLKGKGLLYLVQVSKVEDTAAPDRATHLELIVSEELLHRKEERRARRERRRQEEKEKAESKT